MIEKEIDYSREEILQLRAKTLSEASEQRSLMAALITHPGFVALRKYLQEQVDQRLREVLVMPQSQNDLVQKTYALGEMAGIKVAMDMPDVLIEYAKTSIESVVRSELNEKEQQNGQGPDDSYDETDDRRYYPDTGE